MSRLLKDGYNIFDGYRLQQDPQCPEYFEKYLNIIKPERILELGTANGGLTRILRNYTDVPILTVENEEMHVDSRTYSIADVYIADFFEVDFISTILLPYISRSGRTLVLCDAYNKIHQYRKFVRFIKHDDVIAVHDYFPSRRYFEENIKGKKWNWCDITDEDMEEVNREFDMVDIGEELNEIFWATKLKKGSQKLVTLV